MDRMFQRFLENTADEAQELARRSDVMTLHVVRPLPALCYLCVFRVPYLRRVPEGSVAIAAGPVISAVRFPGDFLRSIDSRLFIRVAALLTPDLVHPNVLDGIVCLGAAFAPGTPLTGVVWQLYEIVTYS